MIYLVHKHTKEHRRYDDALDWPYKDCMVVEADADGWIEWEGGECPLPDDAWVQVKMRDLDVTTGTPGRSGWIWGCYGECDDIIAYRPILDTKPEPPAWDGEGLPPVGCECEVHEDAMWHHATIVAHHDGCAIAAIHRDDMSYEYGAYCGGAIRPIRSEEDRAVEEMRNVMAKHAEVSCGMAETLAIWLYRAGYRKTAAADGEEV